MPSKRESISIEVCAANESALGALASGTETTKGAGTGGEVLLVLALELFDEVIYDAVIEVFPTQVRVTGGSLNLENTLLDGQV